MHAYVKYSSNNLILSSKTRLHSEKIETPAQNDFKTIIRLDIHLYTVATKQNSCQSTTGFDTALYRHSTKTKQPMSHTKKIKQIFIVI